MTVDLWLQEALSGDKTWREGFKLRSIGSADVAGTARRVPQLTWVGKIVSVAQMAALCPRPQLVSAHYPHLTSPKPLLKSGHKDARLLTGGTICQAGQDSHSRLRKGELRGLGEYGYQPEGHSAWRSGGHSSGAEKGTGLSEVSGLGLRFNSK